jgi:cobalt-zinc-cadmium efflux system membrane fusion protein
MKTNMKFLIAAGITLLFLFACGNKEEIKNETVQNEHSEEIHLSQESIKEINLQTEKVKSRVLNGFMNIPATVIANQDNEAQVGSLVQGRVNKVYVKVGDFVKAGQVMMTVEGLDIGEIKADYLVAKAAFNFSKANYERQKKLFDQKVGSQKTFLESEAEFEKAAAEFKAMDKKIHSIGLSDEDVINNQDTGEHTSGTLSIKSPINGIVVERNVVIGQLVDAYTNAFKVINNSLLWIDGQIYEKDLARVTQKTNAMFTTSSYPDENFSGKIIYIGQTIDEITRTITIRGEFNNPGGKLKPQMFGELKIPIGNNVNAIVIPEESLIKDGNNVYVFVQKDKNREEKSGKTFELRPLVLGASSNKMVEVKEGLIEDENVVVKGVFYLKSELKKEELEGDEH